MKEKFTEIFQEYTDTSYVPTEKDSFKDDLGLDSIELIELIMEIENEFDVRIDDGQISGLKTVGDLFNVLK